MEIIRHLNGSEISKEELYSKRFVTEEMKNAMNEVRSRLNVEMKQDDKRKQEE